ncbi:MAG: hypothetical protein IKV65_00150 [Erysipelotrichaceae bacterium]|nr:hypothetical protein [Erysipelotrichaceae bacterium]
MRVYNLDEVIQQLEELKAELTDNKEKNLELVEDFKKEFAFSSSSEALLDLLNETEVEIRMIAKLVISECRKEVFPDLLSQTFDL